VLSLRDESFDISSLNGDCKARIEEILKVYLCRTERVQISEDYEGVFNSNPKICLDEFTRDDIKTFKALDQLGMAIPTDRRAGNSAQLMEFYKAAPWPLSFLSGYNFRNKLDEYKNDPKVKRMLKKASSAWLSRGQIENYKINLANAPHAKTRALVKKLFKTRSEELLWVPPSITHYPLEGSFKGQDSFSKTLLFSSWAMVPRALSGLISYEAERRLLPSSKSGRKHYYRDTPHSQPISFDEKSSMAGWSLVYPSKVLRNMPLNEKGGELADFLKNRKSSFKRQLGELDKYEEGQRSGDRWYALAPLLLDVHGGNQKYVDNWVNAQRDVLEGGKFAQLLSLCTYLESEGNIKLGPMPTDLAEYLAYLSIAGPAVVVARTWERNWGPGADSQDIELLVASSATAAAFAVVSMFNKPGSESIIAKRYVGDSKKYFKKVVSYCAEGAFQAVVDEFGHLLFDAGLPMLSQKNGGNYSATERLIEVMEFGTSLVSCQLGEKGKLNSGNQKSTLRCHYAVPLGNQKTSDEKGLQRIGKVRDAFNSPFRPFMLNSTSIGQEGLDFHWYCHNVVHWNIPSNPIDIEQREGRVNRYKSLVVRRRLARGYGKETEWGEGDQWTRLFEEADKVTKDKGRQSDLVPYWYIPDDKSQTGYEAQIERFVPLMPMSKDVVKYEQALKTLALYRLAFGQPRQDELLGNLLNCKERFSSEEFKLIKEKLMINLAPLRTPSSK